jgi:hypothetical protein
VVWGLERTNQGRVSPRRYEEISKAFFEDGVSIRVFETTGDPDCDLWYKRTRYQHDRLAQAGQARFQRPAERLKHPICPRASAVDDDSGTHGPRISAQHVFDMNAGDLILLPDKAPSLNVIDYIGAGSSGGNKQSQIEPIWIVDLPVEKQNASR